ncbi:MAG TPA: hypothetical protein VIU10_02820 [Candidatus Udaeobacter sp.]
MLSGSRPAGALPSVDLSSANLAREFGSSGTRFTDQRVHIYKVRFAGRAVQRCDYLFVEAAMMFFSAVLQLPV